MANVARVQNKLRLFRESINLVHRGLQGRNHVWIRRLIEAHVAVADLHEAQLTHFVGLHLRTHVRGESTRRQYSAFNYAKRTGSGPGHALQKTSPIDTVIIVVMLNESTDIRVSQILFRHLSSNSDIRHIGWPWRR